MRFMDLSSMTVLATSATRARWPRRPSAPALRPVHALVSAGALLLDPLVSLACEGTTLVRPLLHLPLLRFLPLLLVPHLLLVGVVLPQLLRGLVVLLQALIAAATLGACRLVVLELLVSLELAGSALVELSLDVGRAGTLGVRRSPGGG